MTTERGFIAVYMLTNMPYGTLYTGVTSNLPGRILKHRQGLFDGFTKKHGLTRLVWIEPYESITAAIRREKQVKRYRRDFKTNLIERDNPHWDDLFEDMLKATGWGYKLPAGS